LPLGSPPVTLSQVVVEEDVSGAKPVDERELGKLLERVRSGESEGIVAFKLSRFGRGALETLQAVERIRNVDAVLDGDQPAAGLNKTWRRTAANGAGRSRRGGARAATLRLGGRAPAGA
jgi:hypothetical protein